MNNDELKALCETFSPMEYISKDIALKGYLFSRVIARGKYRGLKFLVINTRGCHPCGYVDVSGTKYDTPGKTFDHMDYMGIDIDCHGGLTFTDNALFLTGEKGLWIGWDYAHLGDYSPLMENSGDKYSTEDVVRECVSVIDQIMPKDSKEG